MDRNVSALSICALALAAATSCSGPARAQLPTPGGDIRSQFDAVSRKLLEMAKDFPAEKYDYRPTKEVRSFGEVIVHVTSGNAFAARAAKSDQVNWKDWSELDVKNYPGKAAIVAALEKSIADANAALKATPDERFTKTLYPWLSVIEHAGEHYGQLVVYYRANGLVPPASRQPAK
jgi:uncharacterized damage-inducible protein DinB